PADPYPPGRPGWADPSPTTPLPGPHAAPTDPYATQPLPPYAPVDPYAPRSSAAADPYRGSPPVAPYAGQALTPYRAHPYGGPHPVAHPYASPYGSDASWSDKSKTTAAVLAFFLGGLGVHNLYLGHTGRGVAQLLIWVLGIWLLGIGPLVTGLWALVEFVLILTGTIRDPQGRALR
ncbi:TM2 domain-containing protein, partial [Desertihabitans aurantiacus]|uniref:TM2 domain-containing protein n=1 Tax=Desertihabitans aurantiacus TaxID=2282477 RepID=UPI0022B8033F